MSLGSTVLFLVLLCLLIVVGMRVLSLVLTSAKRRKEIPVEQFTCNGHEIDPNDRAYPVRYSSSDHQRQFFKLIPWEAIGALVVTDEEFVFLGCSHSGDSIHYRWPRNDSFVSYIQCSKIRDGGLSWFTIEQGGERHFFNTDATMPNLNQNSSTGQFSTTGLYEKITDRYYNA